MAKAKATHLIGAYGMFWERDAIDWDAGRGQTYQLLGFRGVINPRLQVCDFRRARGIYVLFNNHGPTYVGRARGNDGIGSRLKSHDKDGFKDWVRFCWFSFDTVTAVPGTRNWASVVRDVGDRAISADSAIDELEALMITAFGLHGSQNLMKLTEAREPWEQVTEEHCWPGGVGRRVDGQQRIRMPRLREALTWKHP